MRCINRLKDIAHQRTDLRFVDGDPRMLLTVFARTVFAWALYTILRRCRPAGLPSLTLPLTAVLPGLLILTPGLIAEEALGSDFIAGLPMLASILYVRVITAVLPLA